MKKQIFPLLLMLALTVSINTLMAQRPDSGRRPQHEMVDSLNEEQTQIVNTILSKYDSESLDQDDALAIMKELKTAKIPRGKGLETAMKNAGFDIKELGKLAPRPDRNNRQ